MALFASEGPWFRRHPRLAAIVTIGSFVVVTALRVLVDDAGDALGLLYALPVALAAVAFGRAVGTTAAFSGAGLLWVWHVGHPDSGATDIGTGLRALPIILLGILLGAAADAVEAESRARTALAVADVRRRDAAEVQDEILQRLTVAKWRLEAGAGDEAATLLDEAMSQAQGLVSDLLAGVELEDRLRARTTAT